MKYVFLLAFVLAPAYSAYVAAKPAFQAYQMSTCVTDTECQAADGQEI